MVSFKDLTPEEQQSILAEAREMVEQENIQKNARAVFAQKKKELTEKNLDEIYKEFHILATSHKKAMQQKYVGITNMLYRMNRMGLRGIDATGINQITTQSEWFDYEQIANATKDYIISCHKKFIP